MRLTVPVLTVMAVLVGCSGGDPQTAEPVVRDSAGIRIVENGNTSNLPAIHVTDPDLRLELGSAGEDTTQLLYQVEGAHVLSDGRIVVANRGSHELRYYSAEGRFLHAAGRKGAGPGEFDYLTWSLQCGADTVFAYDIGLRRAQLFDEQGRFARGFLGQLPDGGAPYGAAQCWQGTFSVLAWGEGGRQLGYHRPPQPLMTVDADWHLIAHVDTLAGTERWGHEYGSRPAYFGKTPAHTIGPGGIYAGSADTYELRRFAPEGRLLTIIRWRGTALAVTGAHVARLEALEREAARRQGNAATTERALAEAVYPDSVPAYQRFLMALTGELWVQDYQPPGDSVQWWTVFDQDGVALRRVELPSGLYAFEIGPDYVVGRARDALDVEHVRVYRLGV